MTTCNQDRLTDACKDFSRTLNAVTARNSSIAVISNKGKTLIAINRTLQHTVSMTVRG